MEYEQAAAPLWLTVNVSPATVIVPVRGDADELTSTVYPTLPFPVPLPPDVTWIHGALEPEVHAQPTPAVTPTLPVPPADPKFALVGETAYVHAVIRLTDPPRSTT